MSMEDTLNLTDLCKSCKFGKQTANDTLCLNPEMGLTEVAASMIDAFFGDECGRYEPKKQNSKNKHNENHV